MWTWWLEYFEAHKDELMENGDTWKQTTSPPREAQCVVHNGTKYCVVIEGDEVVLWREIPLLGWQKFGFEVWKGAKEWYSMMANLDNLHDQLEKVLFREAEVPLGYEGSPDVLVYRLELARHYFERMLNNARVMHHKFASEKMRARKQRLIQKHAGRLKGELEEARRELKAGLKNEYIPMEAKTLVEQIIGMYLKFIEEFKKEGYL